jgi:hypothetical protein
MAYVANAMRDTSKSVPETVTISIIHPPFIRRLIVPPA